jgi:hypothetical protein
MVIRASTAVEVRALVKALGSDDEVAREGAIARLAVIGARAVDRLAAAFDEAADRRTRLAILRALEAIGDDRAGPIARRSLIEGGDSALAAIAVLRRLLTSTNQAPAADALDALVATGLDASNARPVRLAAIEALEEIDGDLAQRLARGLREDKAPAAKTATYDVDAERLDAVWRDAVDGRLWADPRVLRSAVAAQAARAPLNTLRKLVDAVKALETTADPSSRDAWRALRGALHQALALRGSRVALYDLRESLADDAARKVMPSFLAALQLVGDESCLEPLMALSERTDDERQRHQLQATFNAIVRRERIGPRNRVLKRLETRRQRLS